MADILLVGEKGSRVSELRSLLRQDGHHVEIVRKIDNWRTREREILPELIVAAVDSTGHVLAHRGRRPVGFPAPLLFVQHDSDPFQDVHVDDRLVDRLSSPYMSEDLLARVDALIRVRRVIQHGPGEGSASGDDVRHVPGGTGGIGRRLASLLGSRVPRFERPVEPYLEVASRVANWADRRDAFESGHPERVTSFCALIAEAVRLPVDETESLLRASMLHDIGKIALPSEVLHRTQPLEEGQMRLIRTHPRRGAALLKALDGDRGIAQTILFHHERPDGCGYYGVNGDDVPVSARILAVAEVYDAMTTTSLRRRLPQAEALAAMDDQKGVSLDSDCVEALADRVRPQLRNIPLATVSRS